MGNRFFYYGPRDGKATQFPYIFTYADEHIDWPEGFIQLPKETYEEIYDWCIDQFSGFPDRWMVTNHSTFMFARATDALVFRMRWC